MDVLTHAVLGAAVAEAGFRGKLGGRAVMAGAVLGVLPDLDIVSAFAGPWAVMKYHRGPTHSLLVLALAAPLVAWALRRTTRNELAFRPWWRLSFLALASNPVLDFFTTYGTQLLWPVTDRRFATDAVAIIDPLYTLPLFLALVFACVPRIRRFSRVFAVWAFAAATAYLAFGYVQMERARALAQKQVQLDGFDVREIRATPLPLTCNLLWRIVARDESGNIQVGTLLLRTPLRLRLIRLDRPLSPLVPKALESPQGRIFAWFAMGMVSARLERRGDETVVLIEDQRYGFVLTPTESPFGAAAVFDADGRLLGVEQVGRRRGIRIGEEFHAAWRYIRTGVLDASGGGG